MIGQLLFVTRSNAVSTDQTSYQDNEENLTRSSKKDLLERI